jgi:hypothetical protein
VHRIYGSSAGRLDYRPLRIVPIASFWSTSLYWRSTNPNTAFEGLPLAFNRYKVTRILLAGPSLFGALFEDVADANLTETTRGKHLRNSECFLPLVQKRASVQG